MFSAIGNMCLYCLGGDIPAACKEVFYWLYTYLDLWNMNYMIFRKRKKKKQPQNQNCNQNRTVLKPGWRIHTPSLYTAKEVPKFLNTICLSFSTDI